MTIAIKYSVSGLEANSRLPKIMSFNARVNATLRNTCSDQFPAVKHFLFAVFYYYRLPSKYIYMLFHCIELPFSMYYNGVGQGPEIAPYHYDV